MQHKEEMLKYFIIDGEKKLTKNNMPFKSKAQQKACYASGGFGGKVNCKEYSAKTNQKSLPNRVKATKKK